MKIGEPPLAGKPCFIDSLPDAFDLKLPLTTNQQHPPSTNTPLHCRQQLDISQIAQAARKYSLPICRRLLPTGRIEGRDWVALNPTRNDHNLGSFRVHIDHGYWVDFATGDRGGDLVALIAYLDGISQGEAARQLAAMLPDGAAT